jgi:predicted nucleic acid-binding protein
MAGGGIGTSPGRVALTVVDASIVIAVLDSADAHHQAASGRLRDLRRERGSVLSLPASAYAEALVHPMRAGPACVAIVRKFCAQQLQVQALSAEIAEAAAGLRASHDALRLPDALVIATAEVLGADRLLTTDRRWERYSPVAEMVGGPNAVSE